MDQPQFAQQIQQLLSYQGGQQETVKFSSKLLDDFDYSDEESSPSEEPRDNTETRLERNQPSYPPRQRARNNPPATTSREPAPHKHPQHSRPKADQDGAHPALGPTTSPGRHASWPPRTSNKPFKLRSPPQMGTRPPGRWKRTPQAHGPGHTQPAAHARAPLPTPHPSIFVRDTPPA